MLLRDFSERRSVTLLTRVFGSFPQVDSGQYSGQLCFHSSLTPAEESYQSGVGNWSFMFLTGAFGR